jgi:rhodanese-related sulfurtransferase
LGHIDDARNIPLDQLPAHAVELLGEGRPLVLVCHSDRRSATAAKQLQRPGGPRIAVLRGGMVAWRSHPMP